MIRNIFIAICWTMVAGCILSIFIVIINGGIYLFNVKGMDIGIYSIRRPVGFLMLFSMFILLLKGVNLRLFIDGLRARCSQKAAYWILGVFAMLFVWIKLVQHMTFWTGAYDLSLFDYAIFNTLKGNFMYTPMLGMNFFGNHFSPILFFFVPIYLFYASPIVLLVAHALATVLGGYYIYRLVKLEIGCNLISVLVMISYLGSKSLNKGFQYDFHMELFEPLFILGAFYFFKVRRYPIYWLFLALALQCKEDVAIYILFLGLYICIFGKDIKRGIYTCMLSLIWFLSALKILMLTSRLYGNHMPVHLYHWNNWGHSYIEVAVSLIKNPAFLLSRLFSRQSIMLFSSTLFLSFLDPAKALMAIPPLLVNLTSGQRTQFLLSFYYSVPVIIFVWLASIYGLKRISHRGLATVIAVCLCILNFGHHKFYKIDTHVFTGYKIIKMIPDEAPVSAQNCFVPHIPYRDNIWVFPEIGNASYILVDTKRPCWPFSCRKDFYKELNRILSTKRWEILTDKDGFKLLKSISPRPF